MAATSFADVKVNDQLSLSGFLDMSVSETNEGPIIGSFDQFEVDFLFKFNDKISARADIAQGGVGGGVGAMALEQGFITYANGPMSLMAGKFLSATGWESAEPTGTYQFSYSATVSAYGGYNTGLGASYTLSPMASLYGALFTSEWTGDNTFSTPGAEAGVTLTPVEGLTVKAFYMFENIETDFENFNKHGVNAWASYAKGPLLVAGEVNYILNWDSQDLDADGDIEGVEESNGLGFLVFGNYKVMENLGLTLRYSQLKTDMMAEASNEVTFSPTLSLASNWWVLAEVRQDINAEVTSYAVETTITF
jgi:hypothetical protein